MQIFNKLLYLFCVNNAKEREINKVSHLKDPKREKKKFFFAKKFLFLSEKPPSAKSFQRENKNFFAKNFCFLSFRVF
jgi:hypothetical protein